MGIRIMCAVAALAVLPGVLMAQSHEDHAAHSQYAGMQGREIKALDSAAVADYRAGAGMGFALAAELNGFPGPRHVLELADSLELTAAQRTGTERIFGTMQRRAQELGEQILELERELDRRFAHRHIDAAALEDLTGRIAGLNGRLRAVHLGAHLEMTALLTEPQIAKYIRLRGYSHAH